MPDKLRLLFMLLLASALIVSTGIGAFAHRLLLEHENGVFRVQYDSGTPAAWATVRLLDEAGGVLWQGLADGQGLVKPPSLSFTRALADDGLGHLAEYKPGRAVRQTPRPLAVFLGVSFFLFVAGLGRYLQTKRQPKELKR